VEGAGSDRISAEPAHAILESPACCPHQLGSCQIPLEGWKSEYSMSQLSGKIAVVTGASKGIGASIAEHLAAEGASVVVNYANSKSGADAVVKRITDKGGKAIAIQGDVSKPADAARLFAETKAAYGKLDILVNNAGVYEFGSLESITPEHFHRQFDLNVLGLLLITQQAVKLMGNGGSIINIGSVVGSMPAAGGSVYSATKAAVDAITIALSKELGPKEIRVNSLNPGMVETEGLHSSGILETDFRKTIEAGTPLGRIGQPQDIGRAAVFFASDNAGWITGQTVIAAGGQTS
jgi:3-oxoacyl-[acyl-carrier protein] reductase